MSKPHGTKEFWLAALRADGAAFRAAVADVDPGAPVPPCPDWTVLDLVHHLGNVYGFVLNHVTRGVTDRPERPAPQTPPAGEAVAWWESRFGELLTTLDGLDPDFPAWNWAPQPKKAIFWPRRMAQETAVHRWDAQTSHGLSEPIETKLAVDGITEVLDTWLAAGRRKGSTEGVRGVVALHASDIAEVWYVRLRGEGLALLDTDTVLDNDPTHERAQATGSASDLLLALWGRVPYDVLETAGDMRLLEALRTG
ncbi:hypothetical protein Val02_55000 [Virgisporangium aliadipatigenens]|uniref:Maleylpyruvate isomerase family mycothiol-dependent enzyme n=1 Tax=Virgisporangium aliadipatigenens TaxID=741659 RepID=A0A8J3YN60_9ACTN|nr:maleylpyruvate isomerase family mycothiol-dependent enzyme [Virgisporangium aliadipatigenens]GIJ48614.1 hypothetical protein Val02_55000 [Virgisporangium aliadipatigenens]